MKRLFDIGSIRIIIKLFLLLPIFIIIIATTHPVASETKQIIQHTILNKSELGPETYLLNVQVALIDGRLPNKAELEELSNYLVRKEEKQNSISVHFYLPGMKVGSDMYASANHNPKIKEKIMKLLLFQNLISK